MEVTSKRRATQTSQEVVGLPWGTFLALSPSTVKVTLSSFEEIKALWSSNSLKRFKKKKKNHPSNNAVTAPKHFASFFCFCFCISKVEKKKPLFVLKTISTSINRPEHCVHVIRGRARLQEHFPVSAPTCKLHNKTLQHFPCQLIFWRHQKKLFHFTSHD